MSARMSDVDEVDAQLLVLLQGDDRLSLQELGERVGAPVSTVNDRLKRLTKRGVISGFHARVDPQAVGLGLLAFVFVGWDDPKVRARFLETIKATPEVLECHHVTGEWNYLLKIRTTNTSALEELLEEIVVARAGVRRTQTLITLSTVKESSTLPIAAKA